MYFSLLSFVTKPVLTAASLLCVTTSSVSLTDRPNINTSYAYAIYRPLLLKIVPFGLVSTLRITISSTILKSAVDSASPCLLFLTMLSALVKWPWIITSYFESWNIIFIRFTNFFGISNSFKISYKFAS
jgi:hypothetical protein